MGGDAGWPITACPLTSTTRNGAAGNGRPTFSCHAERRHVACLPRWRSQPSTASMEKRSGSLLKTPTTSPLHGIRVTMHARTKRAPRWSKPLTVEVRIPDGTVVFSAVYTARGNRLEVEAMFPLGTPPSGTPTS